MAPLYTPARCIGGRGVATVLRRTLFFSDCECSHPASASPPERYFTRSAHRQHLENVSLGRSQTLVPHPRPSRFPGKLQCQVPRENSFELGSKHLAESFRSVEALGSFLQILLPRGVRRRRLRGRECQKTHPVSRSPPSAEEHFSILFQYSKPHRESHAAGHHGTHFKEGVWRATHARTPVLVRR